MMENNSSDMKHPQICDWFAMAGFVIVLILGQFLAHPEILPLKIGGVATLGLSMVFIFPPFLHLRKYGQAPAGKSYMETTQLATRGIYAIVRHPQYLGYILLVGGLVMVTPHWLIIIIGLLSMLFFRRHTIQEEGYCRQWHGSAWDEYAAAVPRFNFIAGLYRRYRRRS